MREEMEAGVGGQRTDMGSNGGSGVSGECGGCEFFQRSDWDSGDRNYYVINEIQAKDDFTSLKAPGKWGVCVKVAEFGPRRGSDKFYVIDGSQYQATLQVRTDFGCVEYQEKRQG